MAREYQVNAIVRFVNRFAAWTIRRNIAPPQNYLLTVYGRKTGKAYSTAVSLVK
jgi:hypothetical protein